MPDLADIDGLINRKQVAELFDVTERTVSQWTADDGMPQVRRGRWRISDAVKWWRARIKAAEEDGDLVEERRKLVVQQRHRVELDNAKVRGELVPLDEVQRVFLKAYTGTATQLDGLAPRVAAKVASLNDPATIQRVLFDECRQIRSGLSAELETIGNTLIGGEDHKPAAKKKRRRVGGRAKGAAAGKPGAGAVAN